jgi:hypothetical protein
MDEAQLIYEAYISNEKFNLSHKELRKLPNLPKIANGDFNCSYNMLDYLRGSPEIVTGDFFCYNNKLKSLKLGPIKVGGHYDCSQNYLYNLDGVAKEIKGSFICKENFYLESIEGLGVVHGNVYIYKCPKFDINNTKHFPIVLGKFIVEGEEIDKSKFKE